MRKSPEVIAASSRCWTQQRGEKNATDYLARLSAATKTNRGRDRNRGRNGQRKKPTPIQIPICLSVNSCRAGNDFHVIQSDANRCALLLRPEGPAGNRPGRQAGIGLKRERSSAEGAARSASRTAPSMLNCVLFQTPA